MRQCYQNGLASFAPSRTYVARVVAARTAQPVIPIAPRPVSLPVARPDFSSMIAQQIPEQQLYSKEQLLEMLRRGQSETVERSGESDSGLPNATNLEQKSRDGDASRQYAIDSKGAAIPVIATAKNNALGWLSLAAISFFVLGG